MPGVTPCAAVCAWMRVLYPWLRRFVGINCEVALMCQVSLKSFREGPGLLTAPQTSSEKTFSSELWLYVVYTVTSVEARNQQKARRGSLGRGSRSPRGGGAAVQWGEGRASSCLPALGAGATALRRGKSRAGLLPCYQ